MTTQGDPEAPILRLRITHITSTMSPPLPTLRELYIPPTTPGTACPIGVIPERLPVLRIFGTTPGLQKICANIHLCYPYFYVPFPMDAVDPLRPERVIRYCQSFAVSLNHAICLAMRQNPTSDGNNSKYGGGTDPKHLHVVSVMLVKGIPFYGYHVGYSYFLKVSLANPQRMYVALEQLRKSVVLGREWQPHEAHMNHVLQFMCDFDLYGCGWLDLGGGSFREPLPGDPYDSPPRGPPSVFNSLTTPPTMRYEHARSPPKDTFTPLEIDILPNHILNRNRLIPRKIHQEFVELLKQPLDPEEKLVPAMRELWEDEKRRRATKGLGLSEHQMMPTSGGGRGRSKAELGYLEESDQEGKENRGGDWKISEELWEMLEERMGSERRKKGRLSFERFTHDVTIGKEGEKGKYDKWIKTTFEAVAAHWPKIARPPRSTQKSRRTRKSMASSQAIPLISSSGAYMTSPTKDPSVKLELSPDHVMLEDIDDFEVDDYDIKSESESEEEVEENPFHLAAMTQASQGHTVKAEVNTTLIQRDHPPIDEEEEEEEAERRRHQEDARHIADERQRFHASQDTVNGSEMYDDEELDKLFQRVAGGATTPSRRGASVYSTPNSRSGGSTDRRRFERHQRMVEEAGFGDLSTIIDRSSVSLSSPSNPYDNRLRTPSKPKTPSDRGTPSSMVKNLFAKNRPRPSVSPSIRRSPFVPPNTVVLPQPRTTGWQSPSPEESAVENAARPAANGTLKTPMIKQEQDDIKPKISSAETEAQIAEFFNPPPQQTPTFRFSQNLKRGFPSPTYRNEPLPAETPVPSTAKRVRIASSQQLLSSTPIPVPAISSGGSGKSDMSGLSSSAWTFRHPPPSSREIEESMEGFGVPDVIYQDPFYSSHVDVPTRPKMFAGRMFTLKGNGVDGLQEFLPSASRVRGVCKARYGWEYAPPAPPLKVVLDFCNKEDQSELKAKVLASQLENPTQKNKYGFKFSQKKKSKDTEREHQNMSVLALEVFAQSRHQLLPDPEKDEVTAVFFCYQNEDDSLADTTSFPGYHAGYVVVDTSQSKKERMKLDGIPCHVVDNELDLINWVIDCVKAWDPDVLAGWELHNSSWGFLASRAAEAFGTDLMESLSRVVGGHGGPKKDFYSATHTSTFKVSGRHILNIWRILRSELNLTQYTFENVAFHLLHQRIPHYSAASLTALWKSRTPSHACRVLKYFFQRVVMCVEILDAAEVVTKNAEFARVFGVDFASVMFRGSQFKVESFMFRIAKPESFVLVSPSKQQVGLQNAPFATPLIAEPESKYYNHPIVVLDFQSLYPSVMIAYNICYSTCLGRVEKFKGTDKFGFTELKVAEGLLELLKNYLTVTPNGMIFVKPAVRKSLLAKMLGEILDTRVMVKHAMKGGRGDKALLQLLNARQLGLKLMANVTYGYTSATYSGRMPCIEVADSIVQTGRETLEKAQELIHSRADWGARVVYGDTDSLFIELPGKSKDQAFKIGNDIADTVTALNPKPVKLKFEKVYMGSVLMAKKRYVGFKYEHPDEVEPGFDAKGIETIRRDGFPAQQKIEEVCLKMLFRHQDLSQIKDFCRQEWTKILQGRVSMQDFIIAKEVRLGSYSDKGVPPPGAAVAYRRILKDPRDEPQYAERVPYIVSNTEGRKLIDRARTPEEMLANRSLGIDAEYYIRNLLIPPLSRIFNLVGADVEHWYDSMPRTKRVGKYDDSHKTRIDAHFRSSHCAICGIESVTKVCAVCQSDPATSTHTLLSREHLATARLGDLHKICSSCSGTPLGDRVLCDSVDCPVLYVKIKAQREVEDVVEVRNVLGQF